MAHAKNIIISTERSRVHAGKPTPRAKGELLSVPSVCPLSLHERRSRVHAGKPTPMREGELLSVPFRSPSFLHLLLPHRFP